MVLVGIAHPTYILLINTQQRDKNISCLASNP